MKKILKKAGALLLSLVMVAAFTPMTDSGSSHAAAIDLTDQTAYDNAPQNVTLTYNWQQDLNAITVEWKMSEALSEYLWNNDADVVTEVDWALEDRSWVPDSGVDTGHWQYDPMWDYGMQKRIDSSWEKFCYGISDEGFCYLFDFDSPDDIEWDDGGDRGYCNVLTEDQYRLVDLEGSGDNVDKEALIVNYEDYSVNVRVRYVVTIDGETYCLPWSNEVDQDTYLERFSEDYDGTENLLVNPDFELPVDEGWKDPDGVWTNSRDEAGYYPQHGRFFTWPRYGAHKGLSKTRIYQDVALDTAAKSIILNALVCNYDQPPNDKGRIQLELMDSAGKVLKTYTQDQRNPNWNSQTIVAPIPAGAVKARVSLWAILYVGSDIDAYYDYASLKLSDKEVHPVSIIEKDRKEQASAGDIRRLTANNGKTKDPSAYEWSSSHNEEATVDEKGIVTFLTDAEYGIAIYAKDRESGVTGVYWFNSDIDNVITDNSWEPSTKGIHEGHSVVVNKDKSGHWLECEDCAMKSVKESHNSTTLSPATFTADGSFKCSKCGYAVKTIYAAKTCSVSTAAKVYTGKAIKPIATVKNSKGTVLKNGTDYTVTYSNNTKVGKATVKVTLKGNYSKSASKSFTFKINPKKATVKSAVPGKKSLKVTAGTKVAATGGAKYKIAYRVKGTSTWKYKTTTSNALTIKNLKKGKRYQVKIQAIKTVNKVTYKGAWSAVKTTNKVK